MGNCLIQQRERIAHTAGRGPSDLFKRLWLKRNRLGLQDLAQAQGNGRRRHVFQAELETAREHRDGHFLRIGGGQNEHHVGWRLFKRLEHGVKRMRREHVNFVDHIHLGASRDRCVGRRIKQLRHFIDAAVAGRIHFNVIGIPSAIDPDAGTALPAGRGSDASFAVERLGEDACDRCLSDTARPSEEISVMNTPRLQCVGQSTYYMFLTGERRKFARPPLPCKDLMRHHVNSKSLGRRAGPPALALSGCGCFLPDLTRLTTSRCGAARLPNIVPRATISHRGAKPASPE